ncbi:MAG: pyridoxamine 5'-phosphate oxidase family protein [Methanosarcinales archaeon]
MPVKIPEEMLNILYSNYFGYVCTSDQNNRPHITPVFFIYDYIHQKIFFITNNKSKKVKNIKENPNTCITIDIRDPIDPFNNEGVMAQGKAEIMEYGPIYFLPEETLRLYYDIYLEFKDKYHEIVENKPLGESDVIVQINIEKMVYWKGPHFKSVSVV